MDNINTIAGDINALKNEVGKVFIGQEDLVDGTIAALFAGGHILIEGVPGLGKTLLVKTLGQAMGCQFSRIQFTPDLMPSDVTGSHIYNQQEQKFQFLKGPVFTNLLLADEINRAPAKTHSALLEIMQENQVTLDNQIFRLSPPFFVLATQNPIESEGTYALPEAQLDRFMLKLHVEYPGEKEEKEIYRMHAMGTENLLQKSVQGVLNPEKITQIIGSAMQVKLSDSMIHYVSSLVRATRSRRDVLFGGSPRAGIAIIRCAKVMAVMDGRDFVIPDDIKKIALPAFRHRLLLTPEAEVEGTTADDVIKEILVSTEIPQEN